MHDSTHSHPTDAPSLETIHSILSNRRRRFVVDVLAGREAPIDLTVLARAIAMRLPSAVETNADDSSAVDLDAIATALHHVDLPRLDEADVVDYDPEEHVVTPVRADSLAPYLDASGSLQ